MQSEFDLKYKSDECEGECVLKRIQPICFNKFKYAAFIICCILFVGIPKLLTFW